MKIIPLLVLMNPDNRKSEETRQPWHLSPLPKVPTSTSSITVTGAASVIDLQTSSSSPEATAQRMCNCACRSLIYPRYPSSHPILSPAFASRWVLPCVAALACSTSLPLFFLEKKCNNLCQQHQGHPSLVKSCPNLKLKQLVCHVKLCPHVIASPVIRLIPYLRLPLLYHSP